MARKAAFMQEITDIFWTKKKVNYSTNTRDEQQFLYLKADAQHATPVLPSQCLPLSQMPPCTSFCYKNKPHQFTDFVLSRF